MFYIMLFGISLSKSHLFSRHEEKQLEFVLFSEKVNLSIFFSFPFLSRCFFIFNLLENHPFALYEIFPYQVTFEGNFRSTTVCDFRLFVENGSQCGDSKEDTLFIKKLTTENEN